MTTRIPRSLPMRAIDAAARDGRFQLISNGELFSLARWDGERFVYGSGHAVDFTPTLVHAPEASNG